MCIHSAETNSVLLAIGTLLHEKKLYDSNQLKLISLYNAEENTINIMFFLNNEPVFSAVYSRETKNICIFLSEGQAPMHIIEPQKQLYQREIVELIKLCAKEGHHFTVNELTPLPYDIYTNNTILAGRIIKSDNKLVLQTGNIANGYRTLRTVQLPRH